MQKKDMDRRAFEANFLHEGSIDDGGPYRESFDFVCMELSSAVLPLLIPTENKKQNHGDMRECLILNPSCGKG